MTSAPGRLVQSKEDLLATRTDSNSNNNYYYMYITNVHVSVPETEIKIQYHITTKSQLSASLHMYPPEDNWTHRAGDNTRGLHGMDKRIALLFPVQFGGGNKWSGTQCSHVHTIMCIPLNHKQNYCTNITSSIQQWCRWGGTECMQM